MAVLRPGGAVLKGIEKFRGPVKFAKGRWVGIQCEKPAGRNNGTVKKVCKCAAFIFYYLSHKKAHLSMSSVWTPSAFSQVANITFRSHIFGASLSTACLSRRRRHIGWLNLSPSNSSRLPTRNWVAVSFCCCCLTVSHVYSFLFSWLSRSHVYYIANTNICIYIYSCDYC